MPPFIPELRSFSTGRRRYRWNSNARADMAQEPKLLKDWSAEVKVAVPAITEPAYKEVRLMVYQHHVLFVSIALF